MSQPPLPRPRAGRGRQTALDMARSLAVIAAVGWVVYALVPRSDVPLDRVVDAPAVLSVAGAQLGRDLPVPELPEGWRATSARWDTGRQAVHVGYLTDDDEYAEAAFTTSATPAWLYDATFEGNPVVDAQQQPATVLVAGENWQRWTSAQGRRRALVRLDEPEATIVTGTASQADLAVLAEAISGW